eukprot:19382-Heterococcus_DN1.PRE.8
MRATACRQYAQSANSVLSCSTSVLELRKHAHKFNLHLNVHTSATRFCPALASCEHQLIRHYATAVLRQHSGRNDLLTITTSTA